MGVEIPERFRNVRGTIYWGRDGNAVPKRWIRYSKEYDDCSFEEFMKAECGKYTFEDRDPTLKYILIEYRGDFGDLPSIDAVFVPHGAHINEVWGMPLPTE